MGIPGYLLCSTQTSNYFYEAGGTSEGDVLKQTRIFPGCSEGFECRSVSQNGQLVERKYAIPQHTVCVRNAWDRKTETSELISHGAC